MVFPGLWPGAAALFSGGFASCWQISALSHLPRALAWGATFEALAPMLFGYPLFKGDNSKVYIFFGLSFNT
ncbi:hypothetical protein BME27_15980 [Klebsiella pneumoniae]|nr:hypothetical protein BME27_15980 [Klebsiella pneumoniae]